MQPDNGIFIKTWFDDPHDTALLELSPILREIVVKGVDDVRAALKMFRNQMLAQIERGITCPHLSLDLDELGSSPEYRFELNAAQSYY